ncbi:MAG TPA: hypothetical protein VG013_29235 [Gemmataceae bacterium]|jgi:hypothetical protein|nr:hypothetical protein [Gemmataceae bacterium]
MNCSESEQLWQRQLDGEFRDDAALEQHLAGCCLCRDLHGAVRRLEAAFRASDPPVPPPGLGDRIVERLMTERRARLRWRRRAVVAMAMAASFLGMAALASQLWFVGQRHLSAPAPVAKDQPQPGGRSAPVAGNDHQPVAALPSRSLDDSVKDAGSALVALTRRTAHETIGQSRLLLPDVGSPMSPPNPDLWQQTLEPPAQSLREAGAGVSTGLGPVASSARRAVNMFLQEIPPAQPEAGPGL